MAVNVGSKKIPLPAEEFGLDADGWIEIRTRITGRDYQAMLKAGDDPLASVQGMILAWDIAINGEVIEYDQDNVLDLPIEILNAAVEAITESPLVAKTLGLQSGEKDSNGTTRGKRQARKAR